MQETVELPSISQALDFFLDPEEERRFEFIPNRGESKKYISLLFALKQHFFGINTMRFRALKNYCAVVLLWPVFFHGARPNRWPDSFLARGALGLLF